MINRAEYTESGSIRITLDGKEIVVPDDPTNADWVELSEWVLAGNTIGPFTPPELQIPQVVSRFQARAALYSAGLLDDVEVAIAAADPLVQMAWADAQEFRRDSPTILSLAAVLGLSDNDVDELFIEASEIVA